MTSPTGQQLKAAREKLKLSRRRVCALSGIKSPRTLEAYEQDRRTISPRYLPAIIALINRANRIPAELPIIDI
jgi:transcriptional regulator with XRE-family HTH domain